MITQIQSLHRLYVTLTGLEIRLDMAREQDWVYNDCVDFVRDRFEECERGFECGV